MENWKDKLNEWNMIIHALYCQAQFQLASSVQVQLRTEISLIRDVRDRIFPIETETET